MPFDDYLKRQRLHREAEIAAMLDARGFIDRARDLYDYAHFICDTSGSIAEVVEPDNPRDPVLSAMSHAMLPVYIRASDAHVAALTARFDRAPKPMYYREDMLLSFWADYLAQTGEAPDRVDPDAFIRWGFVRLIEHRRPLYQAIADRWGVTVEADALADAETPEAILGVIAAALDAPAAARL